MRPPVHIVRAAEAPAEQIGGCSLRWLAGAKQTPGAEQTFGVSTIGPGERNPLHYHPNCEEILYVVSGDCEHTFDGRSARLSAGDAIVIPRGVKHNLTNIGLVDVVCVISFSSPVRETVFVEDC